MFDATNHNSNDSGLTAVTEVSKHIVPKLDNIYIFIYQMFYDILRLVDLWCSPQTTKRSLAMFYPCCYCILHINKCIHYKLINDRYVLFPQIRSSSTIFPYKKSEKGRIVYWIIKNTGHLFVSTNVFDGYYFLFKESPKVVVLEGFMFHAWQ